ncbi:MAG: phosphoribosylglycinamide formyltransferase [Candidatus Zixiibacteriota bacterium]|jgi:phosphoribosylglycinamide formyltransferase-1
MGETINGCGGALRIGALASGGGSNLQAIIDACEAGRIDGCVAVVISNNSKAGALDRARRHGIPTRHLSHARYPDDADLDRAFVEALREYDVNVVVLAGYMKKRGPEFLRAFPRRVLNIHPALLPGPHGGRGKYGIHVHESVLAAGDKVTGVTIHLVDEEYDHGPVVARRELPVEDGDTPETLQRRVLDVEHELYPETLAALARGEIDLDAIAAGDEPGDVNGA